MVLGQQDQSVCRTSKLLTKLTMAEVTETPWYNCEICSGPLHDWKECPTLGKLNNWADDNGDVTAWEAWKWAKYERKAFE